MGQFPQDGENGQNVAFFLFFLSLRDNGATKHHHNHRQCHPTALAWALDELGPKRKHF